MKDCLPSSSNLAPPSTTSTPTEQQQAIMFLQYVVLLHMLPIAHCQSLFSHILLPFCRTVAAPMTKQQQQQAKHYWSVFLLGGDNTISK